MVKGGRGRGGGGLIWWEIWFDRTVGVYDLVCILLDFVTGLRYVQKCCSFNYICFSMYLVNWSIVESKSKLPNWLFRDQILPFDNCGFNLFSNSFSNHFEGPGPTPHPKMSQKICFDFKHKNQCRPEVP